MGYVIQQTGLFPHKTVAGNIATVPKLLGWDKTRTRERDEELVDLVGLDRHLPHRYPGALSGGQQTTLCLARALAAAPPIPPLYHANTPVHPTPRDRPNIQHQ